MKDSLQALLHEIVIVAASELPLLARELETAAGRAGHPADLECARIRRDLVDLERKFVQVESELEASPRIERWRKPAYRSQKSSPGRRDETARFS